MAANGVTCSYNRRLAPWEVRFSCADNALSWRLFLKRPIGIGGWRCYNMVNADQINAVRVTVFNLLQNRIPIKPITMAKLYRYKTSLQKVGKRRNSVEKRREHLQEQK